jgi:hypothetical protein
MMTFPWSADRMSTHRQNLYFTNKKTPTHRPVLRRQKIKFLVSFQHEIIKSILKIP